MSQFNKLLHGGAIIATEGNVVKTGRERGNIDSGLGGGEWLLYHVLADAVGDGECGVCGWGLDDG